MPADLIAIFGNIYFIGFVLLFAISWWLLLRDKEYAALLLLCLSALALRIFMAHLDPFLHEWDEKFHALVARNMMSQPFKPVLRESVLAAEDYRVWCCNHIWLHKQPLFMWQMALSMKLFGISEFTARYPSVLMGAIMVVLVYRLAKLATQNKQLAFVAAAFKCVSNYHLELISGYHGMDHNDVAFGFYVLAGIWTYAEYMNKRSSYWLILIGIFAGCAVLNKWLTGLLVFAVWGINILIFQRQRFKQESLAMLAAIAVAVVIFLPWQLYIFHRFPIEASYEFSYNARHVFEVIEGHGGTVWFYFEKFPLYFGKFTWPLVPIGFIWLLAAKPYRNQYTAAILSAFLIILVFFSFIVQSKLQTYFFVVAPLGFIAMAVAAERILHCTRLPKAITATVACIVCYMMLNADSIRQMHRADDSYRIARINNARIYKDLKKYLPAGYNYVINANAGQDIEIMFYNPGITAYHYCPSPERMDTLKMHHIRVAAFRTRESYLPHPEVHQYPYLHIIHADIR